MPQHKILPIDGQLLVDILKGPVGQIAVLGVSARPLPLDSEIVGVAMTDDETGETFFGFVLESSTFPLTAEGEVLPTFTDDELPRLSAYALDKSAR